MNKEEKKLILEELGDIPEELYNELVHEFIAQARVQIQSINEALEKKDFLTVSGIAHSLKGSSGNLRIRPVQNLAQFIELQAKEDADNEVLKERTRDLSQILEEFARSFG
jgi:HPt (histidine-containing phosphotransfer) domain-containing protein